MYPQMTDVGRPWVHHNRKQKTKHAEHSVCFFEPFFSDGFRTYSSYMLILRKEKTYAKTVILFITVFDGT